MTKEFAVGMMKRALWTAAQAMASMLTLSVGTVGIHQIDWMNVLSVAALAAVYSIIKSVVVGIPEAADKEIKDKFPTDYEGGDDLHE